MRWPEQFGISSAGDVSKFCKNWTNRLHDLKIFYTALAEFSPFDNTHFIMQAFCLHCASRKRFPETNAETTAV